MKVRIEEYTSDYTGERRWAVVVDDLHAFEWDFDNPKNALEVGERLTRKPTLHDLVTVEFLKFENRKRAN